MTEIFFTLGLVAALMMMMAVGVLFGRKPLKGSCGGVASGGNCPCADSGTPQACMREDDESSELGQTEVAGLSFYNPAER